MGVPLFTDRGRPQLPGHVAEVRSAHGAPLLTSLATIDRLVLAYAGVIALLALLRSMPGTFAAAAAVGLGLAMSARWAERSQLARVGHDFAPALMIVALFNLSGPVIASVRSFRGDALLAGLDARAFGSFVAAWHGALGRPPWLVDAASIAYVSFYVVPLAVAVVLYRRPDRRAFDRYALSLVATFVASYVGYFLLPTSGPRVPAAFERAVLGGSAVTAHLLRFVRLVEWNQLDAFPSGHTAVSLVMLGVAWRLLPKWRAPLVAVVAAIVFSTVYLSFHYFVDLIAGALLATAIPALVRRLSPG